MSATMNRYRQRWTLIKPYKSCRKLLLQYKIIPTTDKTISCCMTPPGNKHCLTILQRHITTLIHHFTIETDIHAHNYNCIPNILLYSCTMNEIMFPETGTTHIAVHTYYYEPAMTTILQSLRNNVYWKHWVNAHQNTINNRITEMINASEMSEVQYKTQIIPILGRNPINC